jgi:predicted transcriptional regulator of viral defense system
LTLRADLKEYPVFCTQDIFKLHPDFHVQRLSEWIKKGYIIKISKQFYMFSDQPSDEFLLFFISNKMVHPSFVSLETALSYYHLIPEGVYTITAVTSHKSKSLATALATFTYRQMQPKLLFGYQLVPFRQQVIKIAEIEKTILDYFYLKTNFCSQADFIEFRFNCLEFKEKVNLEKLKNYLAEFENRQLEKRVNHFLKWVYHA